MPARTTEAQAAGTPLPPCAPGTVVLGVESSCDETGVALVRTRSHGAPELLGQALHSQVAMHADYGGVVPELASRDHVRRVVPLTRAALAEAGLTLAQVDALACTCGPGLAGALLVGCGFAVALAAALGKPVVAVHHLEGHLLSPFLGGEAPDFPFVALLVSGGHTQLMRVDGVGRYTLLGESIDDAAGEAFDKSAKLLGLGYPGGPALARLAQVGRADAFALPRPLLREPGCDFSFAGLKTAVATTVRKLEDAAGGAPLNEAARADLAASTQAAIVEVLVRKSARAMQRTGLRRLVVSGGVSANARLREALDAEAARRGWQVAYPLPALATDNGAMIALAAAMRLQAGLAQDAAASAAQVAPRWPLAAIA